MDNFYNPYTCPNTSANRTSYIVVLYKIIQKFEK